MEDKLVALLSLQSDEFDVILLFFKLN